MTVDFIDSADTSVGGEEGGSDFVTNLTTGEDGPLPYVFLPIILKE